MWTQSWPHVAYIQALEVLTTDKLVRFLSRVQHWCGEARHATIAICPNQRSSENKYLIQAPVTLHTKHTHTRVLSSWATLPRFSLSRALLAGIVPAQLITWQLMLKVWRYTSTKRAALQCLRHHNENCVTFVGLLVIASLITVTVLLLHHYRLILITTALWCPELSKEFSRTG